MYKKSNGLRKLQIRQLVLHKQEFGKKLRNKIKLKNQFKLRAYYRKINYYENLIQFLFFDLNLKLSFKITDKLNENISYLKSFFFCKDFNMKFIIFQLIPRDIKYY